MNKLSKYLQILFYIFNILLLKLHFLQIKFVILVSNHEAMFEGYL